MAACRSVCSSLLKYGGSQAPPRYPLSFFKTPIFKTTAFVIYRSYKGSNRFKRNKAKKDQVRLEKELELKYGISNKITFSVQDWIKENYFKELNAFQERLDVKFKNQSYLVSALTHCSFIDELKLVGEVEKDDADLHRRIGILNQLSEISLDKFALSGFNIALEYIKEGLYKFYPDMTPLICSKVNNFLTCRNTINMLAKNIALDELLLLSKEFEGFEDIDKEVHLKFSKEDLVSDAFFGFIGAIEKDLGSASAKSFIDDMLLPLIHHEDLAKHVELKDPHKELMKILSMHGVNGPTRARIIAESGVDTNFPVFHVGIYCSAVKIGEGSGYSARTGRIDAFKNTVFNCLEGEIDYSLLRKSKRKL